MDRDDDRRVWQPTVLGRQDGKTTYLPYIRLGRRGPWLGPHNLVVVSWYAGMAGEKVGRQGKVGCLGALQLVPVWGWGRERYGSFSGGRGAGVDKVGRRLHHSVRQQIP